MSYDDAKILATFAKKHDITFPLLADPGSRTIDAYGVRNLDVAGKRVDGIPHPGTFLVDRAGVIRAKLFHEGYKERHAAEQIIDAAKTLDD